MLNTLDAIVFGSALADESDCESRDILSLPATHVRHHELAWATARVCEKKQDRLADSEQSFERQNLTAQTLETKARGESADGQPDYGSVRSFRHRSRQTSAR